MPGRGVGLGKFQAFQQKTVQPYKDHTAFVCLRLLGINEGEIIFGNNKPTLASLKTVLASNTGMFPQQRKNAPTDPY
jgi:hypothetical protein